MRNIKITLAYDGTLFKGWQIQNRGQRTVQAELIQAIQKTTQEKVKLIGSGRTDSGVHALGQTANFQTKSQHNCETLKRAFNAYLPEDITVLHVEDVSSDFHSQYSIKTKTYRYTILNHPDSAPLKRLYTLHTEQKLNLSLMKREAKPLIGTHDFKSFQCKDPSKDRNNTIRTIKRVTIKKVGNEITIDITANGFLYKMVRNIVGTLMALGSGKIQKGKMEDILAAKDRSKTITAPAHGLCLMQCQY